MVGLRAAGALLLACLVWTGCQSKSSRTARYIEPSPPRYDVSCGSDDECNESVALLVGLSGRPEPTRCTAALIGPRKAITAAHCVARELAGDGACPDVWLGFAHKGGPAPEWIACARIEAASTPDPTLLSPDYAILELARETTRRAIPFATGDLARGDVVRMVSITADRFYDDVHRVRSRRCVVEDNERLSVFTPARLSSIQLLSSCPVREGSSGAPVLDRQGRLRGLVHAGAPPYFAFGVMTLLPQQTRREDG